MFYYEKEILLTKNKKVTINNIVNKIFNIIK